MLDVEPDLQSGPHTFDGVGHIGHDPMLGVVEQPVPCHDFRPLTQYPPKLDKVAVAWSFAFERSADEFVELLVTLAGAGSRCPAPWLCGDDVRRNT